MRKPLAALLVTAAGAAAAPAPALAASTRDCGRVAGSGFTVRVLATGARCTTGRSVARRYDITRDSQTILRFRCTFVRRGLARCTKGSAKLRLELRGQE